MQKTVQGLSFTESEAENMNQTELRLQQLAHKMGLYDDNHHFRNSAIQSNYKALVENIDCNEVIDYLYQELIINRDDYERVWAQVTTRDKNRMLLIKLDERGMEGVKALREALSSTPQYQLAQLLI